MVNLSFELFVSRRGDGRIIFRESRPHPQSENTHERDLVGKGLKHWLRDGGGVKEVERGRIEKHGLENIGCGMMVKRKFER